MHAQAQKAIEEIELRGPQIIACCSVREGTQNFVDIIRRHFADVPAESELERLRLIEQGAGTECPVCHWNGIRGDGKCAFCEQHEYGELVKELRAMLMRIKKIEGRFQGVVCMEQLEAILTRHEAAKEAKP